MLTLRGGAAARLGPFLHRLLLVLILLQGLFHLLRGGIVRLGHLGGALGGVGLGHLGGGL